MGLLARLERSIGGFLEGVTQRAFGGRLSARMIAQAVGDAVESRPGPTGPVATNACTVQLNDADLERLAGELETIRREAEERIRRTAEARGLALPGRARVRLENTADVPPAGLRIEVEVAEGPGEAELLAADGTRHPLDGHAVVLGRDPGCELVLASETVSARHARLEPERDHYTITDLGSTNGTLLNGSRVARQALRHGNILTLGTVRLEFRER